MSTFKGLKCLSTTLLIEHSMILHNLVLYHFRTQENHEQQFLLCYKLNKWTNRPDYS